VSLQLPAGPSVLTGLEVEQCVYYAVAKVHAVATSKKSRRCI